MLFIASLILLSSCEPEERLSCQERKEKIYEHYNSVLELWRNQMTPEIYEQILNEMQRKLQREVPECLN